MKDIVVAIGASQIHGTLPEYIRQLSRAGIEIYLINLQGSPWLHRGGHISEKIAKTRETIQRLSEYRYVVMSDGFDVTFYGTKDGLLARMPKEGVLQAAEKNYYPDSGLKDLIPDRGPWRFANGGLSAGSPEAYWKWCDAVLHHPRYEPHCLDQDFMNLLLSERSPWMTIDSNTELFFCLFGGYDELQFVNGEPLNTYHDTWPLFVHANGKWDASEAFHKYHESL